METAASKTVERRIQDLATSAFSELRAGEARHIEDLGNLEMLCCGANKANVRSLIVNWMHLRQRLDASALKVLLEFNK